ncbi:MAG: hypothetical protein ACFCVD_17455 [Nodosilinea sp.]
MANYNETVSGDLSNDSSRPTAIALSQGSNLVSGRTTSSPLDRDFFTFEVPDGFTVSSIILNAYQWGDGDQSAAGYGDSYFALTAGNLFPDPELLTNDNGFLVSKLIDNLQPGNSEIGKDLLDLGVGQLPMGNGAGPGQLGPGVYSVWYQETGASTAYEFDIQLNPVADVFKFEAEALTLDTYLVEDNAFASGEKLVSLRDASGTTGKVSTSFTGQAGTYYILVRYVDETDGQATLDFQVNGESVELWTLDKNLGNPTPLEQSFTEHLIQGVDLTPGALLSIEGIKNGTEEARIDSIQIVAADAFIQIEAEDMLLGTYRIEDNLVASGNALISLRNASGNMGTASTEFTGPSDVYDITVGYLDETDGQSTLDFLVNGTSIDSWILDRDLGSSDPLEQTFIEQEIQDVFLAAGSTLTIAGTQDSAEWARVDFIRIIPSLDMA